MNCEDVQKLIPDHLLGELDAAETGIVCAHLASGCPQCGGVLAETEATLGTLLGGIAPVEPSVRLEERLMARIAPIEPSLDEGPLLSPRHLFTLVAVAAAVLLAVGISWTVFSFTHESQTADLARLQKAIGKRKDEIGALQRALQDNGDFARALRSDEAWLVSFTPGSDQFEGAAARGLYDAAGGVLCMSIESLPSLKADHEYGLWLSGPDPRRLTTFTVTARGEAAYVLNLDNAGLAANATLVVSDDTRGSQQPGVPILVGNMNTAMRLAANGGSGGWVAAALQPDPAAAVFRTR